MYIPSAFRVENPEKLTRLIQQHGFATLITHDGHSSFASHLPVLYRPDSGPHGTLASHMARANPQWQHFASQQEVLVIFHGPHAYISPSWYQTQQAVPTWNYATVHAYGVPILITEHERFVALLRDTVSTYEASRPEPWPAELSPEFRDKLMQAIVGFEIPVTRIEGKFKLGQNRPAADIQGVLHALSNSNNPFDRALADMMHTECNVHEKA